MYGNQNIRVWYEKDDAGDKTGNTVVVIKDGEKRHVGISLLHNDDRFVKAKGRDIAYGRATHAKLVSEGSESAREKHFKNRLSFTVNGDVGQYLTVSTGNQFHPKTIQIPRGIFK